MQIFPNTPIAGTTRLRSSSVDTTSDQGSCEELS
jgi:hypothetical protein